MVDPFFDELDKDMLEGTLRPSVFQYRGVEALIVFVNLFVASRLVGTR
jgi:hypothetical protein